MCLKQMFNVMIVPLVVQYSALPTEAPHGQFLFKLPQNSCSVHEPIMQFSVK